MQRPCGQKEQNTLQDVKKGRKARGKLVAGDKIRKEVEKKNRKRACRPVGHGKKSFIVLGFTFSSRIFTEIKFTHNTIHPF